MHRKEFYKRIILSLFFILPFSMSSSYADTGTLKTSTQAQKKPLEWLFVITAKDGEIKKNEQGQYTLILEYAKIERVLAFTDRPHRIVKMISPTKFKLLWGKGNNSFQKDPPNAIVVFGQEKIAIKLMNVSVDKDKTIFVVTKDDDNLREIMMGDVSVFIDTTPVGFATDMIS